MLIMSRLTRNIQKAADAIKSAKAIIVTAGAGIGVDSGLPDFRGPSGFWRAYPPLKHLGLSFTEISTPSWFLEKPNLAWGFFGHRYTLYKDTVPHEGFHILKKWCDSMEKGYFIFTSNVDGHFQKANFPEDRIVECHGSIHYLQRVDPDTCFDIWPVPTEQTFDVDESTLHCTSALPEGPPQASEKCLARPNIRMFGDWGYVPTRTEEQYTNYGHYQSTALNNTMWYVVIEIGAGLAVPTVRMEGEEMAERYAGGTLIRINPMEPQVPRDDVDIPLDMNGLEALLAIDKLL